MPPQTSSSYQNELDFTSHDWPPIRKKITNLSTLKLRLHLLSTSKKKQQKNRKKNIRLSVLAAVFPQTSLVISGSSKRLHLCFVWAKRKKWSSRIAGVRWIMPACKGVEGKIKLTHHTFPGIHTWAYVAVWMENKTQKKPLRRVLVCAAQLPAAPTTTDMSLGWISTSRIVFGFQLRFT